MSVKSADTLSDVSDHFNGNIEQPCSLHYDYKLINKLTYNHWDCLSACQIESKFILLKKAKFTNYNLPNNALDLKLNIPTFEPNDTLSKYIEANPADPMRELFTSCKTIFIRGHLVNIHISNYLKHLIIYLIWIYSNVICFGNPIIDVYLTDTKCFIELLTRRSIIESKHVPAHPVIVRVHVAGVCYNSTVG